MSSLTRLSEHCRRSRAPRQRLLVSLRCPLRKRSEASNGQRTGRGIGMIATADIVGAIKRRTPVALYPLARKVYHTFVAPVECWTIDVADRALGRTYDGRVLPPALLRFKVRGSPSGERFSRIGRDCANDIAAALTRVGRPLSEFRRILDFGCGCGGTLVWLRDLAPDAALDGTDIDASAIEWCRANLPSAAFATNAARPPLGYADAQF